MLKKMLVAAGLMMVLTLGLAVRQVSAQDSGTAKAAPEPEKTQSAYRLDFTVNEMEDGKKVNTRQYSMNSRGGDSNEIKIGTRVPMEVKEGEFQYLDVGTNIWCRLRDQADVAGLDGNVLLNIRSELSNFALPDQQTAQQFRPVIRQLKIEASTIATVGKPMIMGIVDDPNSKRQFQLEVTVTKLK